MRLHETLQKFWQGRRRANRRNQPPARRKSVRLNLEHLENRLTPATFSAVDVPSLIADINTANGNGVANTINLTAPTGIYTLTAVNNSTDGPTGLPVITSPFLLTINGNWATINRPFAAAPPFGPPAFRLFDVASGAALSLKNVKLLNGFAFGSGASADGGAIYNKGKLTLNGAVLRSNLAEGSNVTALGAAGQNAAGGGIWTSGGSLTLIGSTVLKREGAFGGDGNGSGGNAFGGGIYANLTKVSVGAGCVIESCTAFGGSGVGVSANGGNASGGGLYATGSSTALESVALTGATFQHDATVGGRGGQGSTVPVGFIAGPGGSGGNASGGGLFVSNATLTLSGDHIQNNFALGGQGGSGGLGSGGGRGGTGGDANGGGLCASGGSLTESSFLLLQNNLAQGGVGGLGGNGRNGGPGGTGGNASGGGMSTVGTTVKVTVAPTLQNNVAIGGFGGAGGVPTASGTAGGNGGNGGNGSGGALYASASGAVSLVLENAIVENNGATGGPGGQGAFGLPHSGNGGNGGTSSGGALYLAQNATLLFDTINSNFAGALYLLFPNVPFPSAPASAAGGLGVVGGHGGNGGNSAGGALFVAAGTITLGSSAIDHNEAIGGSGGNTVHANPAGTAGIGGNGTGGAVAVAGGTLSVKSCNLEFNNAFGGLGGGHLNFAGTAFTGTPAFQGAGGGGFGGGLYISGGTLHLTLDDVESNLAYGGFSQDGATSTAASGGGLYKAGGTTTIDAFTLAHIINNTDSNNDAHNNIGP